MHTLKIDVPGYGTWHVHHHGDWSGEVIINGPPTKPGDWKGESMEIPAAVMLALGYGAAVDRVRDAMISALEHLETGPVQAPTLRPVSSGGPGTPTLDALMEKSQAHKSELEKHIERCETLMQAATPALKMRPREEVEKDDRAGWALMFEVLLDIRDLLAR